MVRKETAISGTKGGSPMNTQLNLGVNLTDRVALATEMSYRKAQEALEETLSRWFKYQGSS